MKTGIAGLFLCLALGGCQTTETRYGTVNGMSYCKNCKAMIVGTSNSTKAKLPNGGYAGANVDLGSIDKSETRADVSKTLGVINQSIVSACEGQKAAAFSGDRPTYDNWAKVQQNQIVKLQQPEGLMVGQENTTALAPAAAPAAVAETQPGAAAEASPKPARKKKDAGLKKWASAYSPKHSGSVKLPKGTKVGKPAKTEGASEGSAPTPPVVTEAVKAVLETQPESSRALGLPPKK